MSKVVVVNSTSLIALAKCGRLDLLKMLFGSVVIPQAVYDEVFAKNDVLLKLLSRQVSGFTYIILRIQKIKRCIRPGFTMVK